MRFECVLDVFWVFFRACLGCVLECLGLGVICRVECVLRVCFGVFWCV